MKTFQEFLTEKTLKLNKDNIISYDANSEAFAKEYMKGMRGDFNPGGPSPQDEKNAELFYNNYESKISKKGFAGSGTTIYTNKESGEQFKVEREASGKGFYGSNHFITKL